MTRNKKDRRPAQSHGRYLSDEMMYSFATTPATYLVPITCNEAWASWYGSMDDVLAIRNEIIESGIKPDGFTRSNLKLMKEGMLISTVLLNPEIREALAELIGEERVAEMVPQRTLYGRTRQIIGDDVFDTLRNQILSSTSLELLESVKAAMPKLGDVIEVGGFSRELVTSALMLRAILDIVDSNDSLLRDDRTNFRLDMIVHLYLQMIPVDDIRSSTLIEYPRFATLYPGYTDFGDVDPQSPVFGSGVEMAAVLSAAISSMTTQRRLNHGVDVVDAMLETLQAFSLASSETSRFTEFAIVNVLQEANEGWKYLLEAIRILNVDSDALSAAGIDLDVSLFPNVPPAGSVLRPTVIDCARMFRGLVQPMLVNNSYCVKALDLNGEIEEVNQKISEIATSGKNSFEQLGELSRKGAELSVERNQLTADVLKTATTVMNLARRLSDTLLPIESVAAPESGTVMPLALPSAMEPLPSRDKGDVESELWEINTQLETDLKASQAEVFRLSAVNEALQVRLETPTGNVDHDFQDLTRRQILRQRLSPEELLRFFGYIASDRIVVLDSAWRSARQADKFAYPDRLNEQLNKLVFDYLDQIRAGAPMGRVGKEMFAGAFAAKESQSVSQAQAMRAQREFLYNGETRFFEYRLRVANGWGPVEGMRVYFDVIDGKVVIAYVGPHLDQVSTN